MRDFDPSTISALARRGITILRPVAVPTGEFAGYERCYSVNDNGCGRIWTFNQVRHAASVSLGSEK